MVREESLNHGLQTRNIDGTIRRTEPHLLNQQNRKGPNMRASTPICQIFGGSRVNPTNASSGNSSSLLQSQTAYTGVAPQDGVTKANLYLSDLLSTTSKNSATSGSPYKEGTPREASHNPSEHTRLLLEGRESGGSNPRTLDYQLPHQLFSFYHVVPHTNGNNTWNHPQHQQMAQYHCSQPGRNEQLALPSYWSSQHTSSSNILAHAPRTRATFSSVVGKCPTVSNPAQSSFQFQPPPSSSSVLGKRPATSNPDQSFFQSLPSNADDMGRLCRLETDDLLRLFQSMGMPEFLAISDRVLRSGSSQHEHDPLRAASDRIPVRGTSAAAAPNLLLGLGNGGGIDKGKGKEACSYWDLDAMVEMESMNKRLRKVTGQEVPDSALGSDGQGGSKDKRN